MSDSSFIRSKGNVSLIFSPIFVFCMWLFFVLLSLNVYWGSHFAWASFKSIFNSIKAATHIGTSEPERTYWLLWEDVHMLSELCRDHCTRSENRWTVTIKYCQCLILCYLLYILYIGVTFFCSFACDHNEETIENDLYGTGSITL